MNVKFNVTGTERKKLVTAVSEVMGTAAVYNGAPTFSYTIGSFTVDKYGTLTAEASVAGEYAALILHRLEEQGFSSEQPAAETEEPVETQMPLDGQLTIEIPLAGFTDTSVDNLRKLVESKAGLIKKALGVAALPIEVSEDKISFPWFRPQGDAAAVRAYTHFAAALCEQAKILKRVTAVEKETDNEKYAFRCFLLRLGFIGKEYKAERKVLLANLTGNGAFKSVSRRQE